MTATLSDQGLSKNLEVIPDVLDAVVVPDADESYQGTQALVEAAKNYRDAHNELTGMVRLAYLENWYVEEFGLSQDGWEAYLLKYIGPALGGIKGVERVRLVSGFTAIGMSSRIQAAVLNVSHTTVQRDQAKAEASSGTPDSTGTNVPVEPPASIKGANGKEYKKKFTCSQCKVRKDYETRVEIESGTWACEPCADEYDAAKPAIPAPEPTVSKMTSAKRKLIRLETELSELSTVIPWSNKTAIKIFALAAEIETAMEELDA